MNAANEAAVQAFIDQRISLTDIPLVIEAVMNRHHTEPANELNTILEADRSARIAAASEIQRVTKPTALLAEM